MKQITEGVYFIPGQDGMIPDCHVYIIGKPSSGDLTLVDAGLMGKNEYKIRAIEKAGIDLSDIKRVIMTHTHLDHLGCLPEIKARLSQAEVWMHGNEAEPLEKGDERIAYGMKMFEGMVRTMFGKKPGAYSMKVDRRLKGDETLEIGKMLWEVIHVPGHSPGGIALYNPAEKILIPGDVVYADHAIGRFDFHGASGRDLNESLLALSALEVKILLPGHNRIMKDVPHGYILETEKQWEAYLV
ncbi:Metallo-beta-lactamase domain protein [uncultured Desulfobacterium sp.]|uniref:Metallo-beta-lactamase domain protein n=1 Tax=uncultured Desulfobacterium sp. TaxID=201089 RepID=A0A445MZB5_9BACT|nr:Metallo-beta-lactamase domain protein [uncultured Desulfobacterium sp.]